MKLFQGSSALSSIFLQNGPVFVEKMVYVGRLIMVSTLSQKAELNEKCNSTLFNDRSDLPSRCYPRGVTSNFVPRGERLHVPQDGR